MANIKWSLQDNITKFRLFVSSTKQRYPLCVLRGLHFISTCNIILLQTFIFWQSFCTSQAIWHTYTQKKGCKSIDNIWNKRLGIRYLNFKNIYVVDIQ